MMAAIVDRISRGDGLSALVLALAAIGLWLTAPMAGDFAYSDAPRHALNGVFIKDLIAAFPWRDPAGYAMQYYIQYPALTILFYPPLFYAISAPFYAVFGVSQATALAVVMLHYLAFALGMYTLARRWLTPPVACAVGLLTFATPLLSLWGRQVMLEIPCLAFAVWAFVALARHGDTGRPAPLYAGAFLLLCALYTKLNAVFLLPVAALMIWSARGSTLWRSRHTWIVAALFIIGLVPLVLLTLKFGQINLREAVDRQLAETSRPGASGWFWYGRQLVWELGWPLLVTACLWPVVLLWRWRTARPAVPDLIMLIGWAGVGYIFLSAIELKSGRYSTIILPPFLLCAGLVVAQITRGIVAPIAAGALTVATFAYGWISAPVPAVAGYREAAALIARDAPRNAVVLFSGKRDGSFVFNMRTMLDRPDIYTVRADKLLLEIAVDRDFGVRQKGISELEIGEMLDRYGVSYVVAQADFWTDLEVMARLERVLSSSQFTEIASIPVVANVKTEDQELRIYRNTHPVSATAKDLRLSLPIINRSVEGRVGGRQ